MTAEELCRLAEIAGYKEIPTKWDDFYVCRMPDWEPHLRIDQAMMVAEGLRKIKFYIELLLTSTEWRVELISEKDTTKYIEYSANPAEAICRAALAAAKDGNERNLCCNFLRKVQG